MFAWWIFLLSYSASSSENPSNIHFIIPGTYLIRLQVSENGCVRERLEVVKVFSDPKVNVQLSDTIGCEPLSIKFKSIPDSTHLITSMWNINGLNYVDSLVFLNFPNTGVYSFSVVVKDSNNCRDTLRRLNFIKINRTPKVQSFVNPTYSSILYPKVTFIDSSNGDHFTSFNFGDGNFSSYRKTVYNYQSPGIYDYSLIVSTEFGCADTTSGTIYIDDIGENYVPNVFTPNNDGVNDVFFIKGESISSSEMVILNRWGGKVFESVDALKGWDGIEKHSDLQCSEGTYFYIISITLEGTRKYKFNGTVQLVR